MSYRDKSRKETEIFTLLKIFSVGKINWKEQTIPLRIGQELAMHLSKEEHNEFNKNPSNYSPSLWPSMYPINSIDFKKERDNLTLDGSKFRVIEYDGKLCLMKETELSKIKFQSQMDFTNFPFDYQFIELIFNVQDSSSKLGSESLNEIKIRPRLGGATFGRFFVPPQGEYSILSQEIGYLAQENLFTIVFVLKRNWTFYFWRVFLLFGLLSLIVPFCLLNKFGDLGTALTYLMTVLLFAATLTIALSHYLNKPKVLTLLDKYVYSIFIYIFFVMFQRCSVSNQKTSMILFWVDITAWIFGHVLLTASGIVVRRREKRKNYGKPINWKINKN